MFGQRLEQVQLLTKRGSDCIRDQPETPGVRNECTRFENVERDRGEFQEANGTEKSCEVHD